MNLLIALLIAATPVPPMAPQQCRVIAQYLFWVADYRDVKADKEILKARMRHENSALLAFVRAEIDRIYASAEDGEQIANDFMLRCLNPHKES